MTDRTPTRQEHESAVANARPRGGRRNTELGDQACFCAACGWARRYYPHVVPAPEACPDCGGPVVSACPACDAPIGSVMAVTCQDCGAALRERTLPSGLPIRRSPRRLPMVPGPGDDACS